MILLYGYYGERNAGDDAFTTVCTTELVRCGQGPLGVLANELPRVKGLPARPLLFHRRFRGLSAMVEAARTDRWLRKGARIVVGGGSLFGNSAGLLELERLLQRSPISGHHAMGVSIGPFRDDEAAAICARILPRFDSIGVRDMPSLERARELAPFATVELTFDLAPLLPRSIPEPLVPNARATQDLGVALCGPALSELGFAAIRGAVEAWLVARPDRRVVLLPFNDHPRKGDLAVHQRLADEVGMRGPVELYRYSGDPRALWGRVAQLDGLIAMRLHAAVFGYCTERPVLIVPYEEKCTAWADMIGQKDEFVVTPNELTGDHVTALTSLARPTALLPVTDAEIRALTNFRWAER